MAACMKASSDPWCSVISGVFSVRRSVAEKPALVNLAIALEILWNRPGAAILDSEFIGQVVVQAEPAQVGREYQHAVGGQATHGLADQFGVVALDVQRRIHFL